MGTFRNQASLSFNGNVSLSNVTIGELVEVISATKLAIMDDYVANDDVTYIINIVNSSASPFSGIKVTDDLGGYQFGTGNLYPLTFVTGSMKFFINGVLQTTGLPTVAAGPPLVFTNINIPASSNVSIIYEANVNEFAPLALNSTITNAAYVSEGGISEPIEITKTISTQDVANPIISKSISPSVVSENGQLTYTFVIQNFGNTEVKLTDDTIIADTFDPPLNPISVTFNSTLWAEGTHYDYDESNGEFETRPNHISVPAATFTQDTVNGNWIVTPGVSTLKIVGTI